MTSLEMAERSHRSPRRRRGTKLLALSPLGFSCSLRMNYTLQIQTLQLCPRSRSTTSLEMAERSHRSPRRRRGSKLLALPPLGFSCSLRTNYTLQIQTLQLCPTRIMTPPPSGPFFNIQVPSRPAAERTSDELTFLVLYIMRHDLMQTYYLSCNKCLSWLCILYSCPSFIHCKYPDYMAMQFMINRVCFCRLDNR